MKNFNILDYIQEAEELEKLFSKFIGLCDEKQRYGAHLYDGPELNDQAKPVQRELLRRYEVWFAVTKLIARQYSDKYSVFEENYDEVKQHILVSSPN